MRWKYNIIYKLVLFFCIVRVVVYWDKFISIELYFFWVRFLLYFGYGTMLADR